MRHHLTGPLRARVRLIGERVRAALDGIDPAMLPEGDDLDELVFAFVAAADALVPATSIPVVGPVIEALDGLVLAFVAKLIVAHVREQRARAGAP